MGFTYFTRCRRRAALWSSGRGTGTVRLCSGLRLSLQVCFQPLCKLCLLSTYVQVPRLQLNLQFLHVRIILQSTVLCTQHFRSKPAFRAAVRQLCSRNWNLICPTSTVSFFTSSTFMTGYRVARTTSAPHVCRTALKGATSS